MRNDFSMSTEYNQQLQTNKNSFEFWALQFVVGTGQQAEYNLYAS